MNHRKFICQCMIGIAICFLLPIAMVAQSTKPQNRAAPNIVLINLDDADIDALSPESLAKYFPNMNRLRTGGIYLSNLHVTTPLCGPSRACLFRGQYAHRCEIRINDPAHPRSNGFQGGMRSYVKQGFHQNDISTWMKDGGYHTAMVGKFLHGSIVNIVPQGWDDFYSSRGANYFGTARLTSENKNQPSIYSESFETYRTTQESSEVLQIVERHVARQNAKPLFMYIAPLAPHRESPSSPHGMIEPQYKDLWHDVTMPRSPDVLEEDRSDKSTAIRNIPNVRKNQANTIDEHYRQRIVSLKSVDDMVGHLLSRLTTHGMLDNTYIILTSDNGFSNTHHNMIGKSDAFDRSTRVPSYVMGPGIAAGSEAKHLLGHIDIAPTILELADAEPFSEFDGISFKSVLTNPQRQDAKAWRKALLIENYETRSINGSEVNAACLALRYFDSVYVEWANGTPEFYDLTKDPFQLENVYDSLTKQQQESHRKLIKSFRQNPANPTTTVSQPFDLDGIQTRTKPISGMADDDTGIAKVDLTFQRLRDGKFWNGTDWQWQSVANPARVTNPGQQLTTWFYDRVPFVTRPNDLIAVWAEATDVQGNVDQDPAWVVFRLDYNPPRSEFKFPELEDQPVPVFDIRGKSYDDDSVESVRLVIRNQTTKMYWTGDRWSESWTVINVPVRGSQRWAYTHPHIEGFLYVGVRSVDTSGNVESPPTTGIIHVVKN